MMSVNDSVVNDLKEVSVEKRRVVGIMDLPDELYRLLQEFCSLKELCKLNRHLYTMKGSVYHYKLTKERSREYYNSDVFRAQVQGRVIAISRQLNARSIPEEAN